MVKYLEFLRFCLVGGTSALLSICLLFILTEIFNIHYILSFVISYIIVNTFSYVTSRRYAFMHHDNRLIAGALRYFAVSLFSLTMNTGALYILVNVLEQSYLAGTILLSALNAPVNYILHKRISFQLSGFPTRIPKG